MELFSSLSPRNSAMRFRISDISVTNWPIVRPQISKEAKQKVAQLDKFAADFVQKELKRGRTSGKYVFSS
jgi:hypothetical protein